MDQGTMVLLTGLIGTIMDTGVFGSAIVGLFFRPHSWLPRHRRPKRPNERGALGPHRAAS